MIQLRLLGRSLPLGRSLLLPLIILLAFAGAASAQYEPTPEEEWIQQIEQGAAAVAEATPAESAPAAQPQPLPPPPVSIADTLWQPTVDQLTVWLTEGIAAAGIELDFFEMPTIDRLTWSTPDGIPLAGDRTIHFAAVMTPEFTSYAVGYGASWDEDTWKAIQEDVTKVSGDLANSLRPSVSGGSMYIPIALYGPAYTDMQAAVCYEGQWRVVTVTPWGTLADYTAAGVGRPAADPQWAAKYMLTQLAAGGTLQPADQVRVYLCSWNRNGSTQLDADFRTELPQPEWTDPKRARLAIGNADLLAWVDFDLMM